MQASSQYHPFEGQDDPCSSESEATVATEDLPHTADWIALRQRQASQLQSFSVSSSFDSQDTVLTADLPDTNDWLRLRKFRDGRTSNDTTTRAQKEEAKSKPSTATLGPTRVTPPGQNERNPQRPEKGITNRDRTEPESHSEATIWSFDENDVLRHQRENAIRHTASKSKIMNPNHQSPKQAQWKSDAISPLTQQDCAQGHKSNGIQSLSQRRTINTKTTVTIHNNTVSSPLLFPRKRRQLPQSPTDSIASNPLSSTRIINTLRPPSSTMASKSNSDSDAATTTTTTPSPPQKQQPWFQKKTKKRKMQQVRLTFG